mmetsp:Transcript_3162/g.3566  ORF Transcript_3162/g.3566 Transcript_3162/m.3566 type:complete len:195 (-) Transcript_3162:173-757(-)
MVRFCEKQTIFRSLLLSFFAVSIHKSTCSSAFSMSKTIYGVPNSGWTSPQWNWGYGSGTGHDCAAICRNKYGSREERATLIRELLDGNPAATNMEEVKLVLALKWQRDRRAGYSDVLDTMAEARRYEQQDDEEGGSVGDKCLIEDMAARFDRLNPQDDDKAAMEALRDSDDDVERAVRRCSGLVLQAMGFADRW